MHLGEELAYIRAQREIAHPLADEEAESWNIEPLTPQGRFREDQILKSVLFSISACLLSPLVKQFMQLIISCLVI